MNTSGHKHHTEKGSTTAFRTKMRQRRRNKKLFTAILWWSLVIIAATMFLAMIASYMIGN